jgi:3-phosphoshikimate 1-carboxyvinyltransferase
VPGPGEPKPGEIATYDEHRRTIRLAVLGLRARGIVLKNPACAGKTFSSDFDVPDRIVPAA